MMGQLTTQLKKTCFGLKQKHLYYGERDEDLIWVEYCGATKLGFTAIFTVKNVASNTPVFMVG
jgi:hypothetical protein